MCRNEVQLYSDLKKIIKMDQVAEKPVTLKNENYLESK